MRRQRRSSHQSSRSREESPPPAEQKVFGKGCIAPTGCQIGKPVDDYDIDTRIIFCCNKNCPYPKDLHRVCYDNWKSECVKRIQRSVTSQRNDWTSQWLNEHLWHASCMKILAQRGNNCRCPCGGILCGGPIDRSNSFFDISATFDQELPKPIESKQKQMKSLPNVQLAPPVKCSGAAYGFAVPARLRVESYPGADKPIYIGKYQPVDYGEPDTKKSVSKVPLGYKPVVESKLRWEDTFFVYIESKEDIGRKKVVNLNQAQIESSDEEEWHLVERRRRVGFIASSAATDANKCSNKKSPELMDDVQDAVKVCLHSILDTVVACTEQQAEEDEGDLEDAAMEQLKQLWKLRQRW